MLLPLLRRPENVPRQLITFAVNYSHEMFADHPHPLALPLSTSDYVSVLQTAPPPQIAVDQMMLDKFSQLMLNISVSWCITHHTHPTLSYLHTILSYFIPYKLYMVTVPSQHLTWHYPIFTQYHPIFRPCCRIIIRIVFNDFTLYTVNFRLIVSTVYRSSHL